MRTLYHLPLSPFCRKVRIVLAEKSLDFTLETEKVWERRPHFLNMNPAGQVPVLQDLNGTIVVDSRVICEYLEEAYPEHILIGKTPTQKAETRRLIAWFDEKFDRDVTRNLLFERTLKRQLGHGGPDSAALRVGSQNIHIHLEYITWLSDRRNWLAGDHFSLADIAAASHLSCLDYLSVVPWEKHPGAKDWYARIKSRPSFRPLLRDMVPGIQMPSHYADLDF